MSIREIYKNVVLDGCGQGIYGEITMCSMQKIIEYLKKQCMFDSSSIFLDIGAGLGKPNIHVAVETGALSVGIEVEYLRWVLSLKNVLPLNKKILMIHGDIETLSDLDPFTHIYMFDIGFNPMTMTSISESFNASRVPKILICYKKPKVIERYGFNVQYLGQLKVTMCGSRESHTVYFYTSGSQIGKCHHINTRYCPDISEEMLRFTGDFTTRKALYQLQNLPELQSGMRDEVERFLSGRKTRSHEKTYRD